MALAHLRSIRHEPFAGGAAWGEAGPYELTSGVAHFAVDPAAEANRRITDLGRAERHEGEVRFSADVRILGPAEASGPTNLLYAVCNRGAFPAVPLSSGIPWYDPGQTELLAGDGFLLRHGWTIAWCGWQWDVVSSPSLLGLAAPEALDPETGGSIEGDIRVSFRTEAPIADHALGDSGALHSFRSYPAADVDQPDAVLTVAVAPDGERRVVERDRWRFARDEEGKAVADDEHVWLEGGFEAFRHYELIYRTRRSPVVGTGFLAVRDFVSFLRHGSATDPAPAPGVAAAFAFGASQSGRFLRQFLHEGLNLDEAGRQVFDGVLPHVAGARLGEFNQRYGQPAYISDAGMGSAPPYSPAAGLFERQVQAGGMPKVVLTNTSWEYYRGDAALSHIDPTGAHDLEEPAWLRNYLVAGADHLGSSPMKETLGALNPLNDLDAMVPLRAVLTNLVAWATEGVEPPPSNVPRVADGTAVAPEKALDAVAIPGAYRPEVPAFARLRVPDLGPDADAGVVRYPVTLGEECASLVPAVDADGNEIPGIHFPDADAPVATFTGWNFRRHVPGVPDAIVAYAGSELTFPLTPEAAAGAGDSRRALSERYAGREEYAEAVRAATAALVARRHLLAEDADAALERCLARYDRAVAPPAP